MISGSGNYSILTLISISAKWNVLEKMKGERPRTPCWGRGI